MFNQTLLIAVLLVYAAVLVIIGILDARKTKTFTEFAVAGKSQKSLPVILSLLASVIGASTTIGIVDTTYKIGFPGIWWLLFGAVGLLLQSVFLSRKVRDLNADTLPDVARITVNRGAEVVLSLIIVISWIGVIAGQLVAMSGLISLVLGTKSRTVFIIIAAAVILYTAIGGQLSVVRTDMLQFVLILTGVAACFICLYFVKGGDTADVARHIEFINQDYRPIQLFTQFFIIGGVYFLGPDIMSRNLLSRDGKTAKKSAFIGGVALIFFSVLIVLIGMWAKYNVQDPAGMQVLLYIVKEILPGPVGVILAVGLVSAILSSTDTCIINASTILVRDILKKESVWMIRGAVVVIGGLAMAFALSGNGDIISLLSSAYSVYTPGVIFPLLIAILCYGKKELRKGVWIGAVIAGGIFGILGSYFPQVVAVMHLPAFFASNLSLIGMGISLLVGLCSVKWKS